MSDCESLSCEHLVPDDRAEHGMVLECPRCKARSANPYDIRGGYCLNCHEFVTEPHLSFRPDITRDDE